jgi:hypothetical protein
LLDAQGHETAWANYAYDMLHFARWWLRLPARPPSAITHSTLCDYVRDQAAAKKSRLRGATHPIW